MTERRIEGVSLIGDVVEAATLEQLDDIGLDGIAFVLVAEVGIGDRASGFVDGCGRHQVGEALRGRTLWQFVTDIR